MSPLKVAALILIAVGVVGLAYGGFSYTRSTTETQIGPIDLVVHDKQQVNIPIWAGVGAIMIGAAMLLVPGKNS